MVSPVSGITIPSATTSERDSNFTSVPNGFQFYNTTSSNVQITFDGGATWANVTVNFGGAFLQTSDGPIITATTVESDLLGAGVGTLTADSNTFEVSGFRLRMSGNIGATGTDTLTIRIKLNGTVILSSLVVDLDNATSKFFSMDASFTIRTLGGPGVASVISDSTFTYNQNAGDNFVGGHDIHLNSTDADTTISNTISVTGEFSSANASNSIQTISAILMREF